MGRRSRYEQDNEQIFTTADRRGTGSGSTGGADELGFG